MAAFNDVHGVEAARPQARGDGVVELPGRQMGRHGEVVEGIAEHHVEGRFGGQGLQQGAAVAGIGVVIEKGFQGGGDELRQEGYNVKSLAIIDSMRDGTVKFRD